MCPRAVGLRPEENVAGLSVKAGSGRNLAVGVLSGLAPGKGLRTKPGNVLPSLFPSLLIHTTPTHSFPSIFPKPGRG